MVDLREKVKEDRGLLKKIELAIPGFRGYRKKEDLRIADSLLRKQLADKLKSVLTNIEQSRETLTRKMEMDMLEDVRRLVNQAQVIEGKVRHAEQGYTGVSADYRINESELNRLYEWDLGLITHINELKNSATMFQNAINIGNKENMRSEMDNLNGKLLAFEDLFEKRREAIAGLGVE
jgi:hypothetical protein